MLERCHQSRYDSMYIIVMCLILLHNTANALVPGVQVSSTTQRQPICPSASVPSNNTIYTIPADRAWEVVATTRPQQHSVEAFPPAVLVAYVSRSNPWSLSLRNLLCCVPRFFREEDCIFLRVFVEDMTFTEQMHHRLSSVPAMKLYTKGRRYSLDKAPSLVSLADFISLRAGVGPLMDVEYARQGAESAVPCSTQIEEVTAADFARAGWNGWLALSVLVLVLLLGYHTWRRHQRRQRNAMEAAQ